MAYLVFNSPNEAKERSEEAGKIKGLSYHNNGTGSRYWWGWLTEPTEENPRAYIEIEKNVWTDPITEEEKISIPEQVLLKDSDELLEELPEDWAVASNSPLTD